MVEAIRQFWRMLRQEEAESDDDFVHEIRRRAWSGLRNLGLAIALVPLGMSIAVQLLAPHVKAPVGSVGLVIATTAIGLFALGLRRSGRLYNHARRIAFLAVLATCFCLIWGTILRSAQHEFSLYLINGQIAVALMIGTVAIPFRPTQVLALGLLADVFFFISSRLAVSWTVLPDDHVAAVNVVYLTIVGLLATAMAASLYRQMYDSFHIHRLQLEASDEMRDAQCRMLLSESATSMARLAAALSHELNNPLGVLKSNLDTMSTLIEERIDAPPEKLKKLSRMKQELCRNSRRSVERLQDTVRRMQRFTNLDRADILLVNINEVVRDVADVVAAASEGRAKFEFDLAPAPDVEIRPQLVSAVLSALLQNAVDASPEGMPVSITSRVREGRVVVTITDRGRGMSPEELAESMEPSFRVKNKRIIACNWNLFSARQIIRGHGGEVEIASEPGAGTRVEVSLPLQRVKI